MKFSCYRGFSLGSLIAAGIFAVGCSGGGDTPSTVEVTGLVTLDGSPVDGATVTFSPTAGDGLASQGVTGPDGVYSLDTTFDRGKTYKSGAVPGAYLIAVEKLDLESPRPPAQPPKNLLPVKYATPATSGLTHEVTEGGENTAPIDLVSP